MQGWLFYEPSNSVVKWWTSNSVRVFCAVCLDWLISSTCQALSCHSKTASSLLRASPLSRILSAVLFDRNTLRASQTLWSHCRTACSLRAANSIRVSLAETFDCLVRGTRHTLSSHRLAAWAADRVPDCLWFHPTQLIDWDTFLTGKTFCLEILTASVTLSKLLALWQLFLDRSINFMIDQISDKSAKVDFIKVVLR
jgi:hypothetical protein